MNDRPTSDRLASVLAQRTPVPGEWRSALAARADDEDLLDVAYRVLPTAIGDLLLAATTDGLVRVAFAAEGFDDAVLDDLAAPDQPPAARVAATHRGRRRAARGVPRR